MICRYRFIAEADEKLLPGRAYAFYSALLSLLPDETAERLHLDGETPVSQFLYHDREAGRTVWQISVFGRTACDEICPVLDGLDCLRLNTGTVRLECIERIGQSAAELIADARSAPAENRVTLEFLTPTAFRQSGRYVFMPSEKLILNSLLNKWNSSFPEYPLNDPDAVGMLESGLSISGYSLRSRRFPLKDVKLPGFCGTLTVSARLSAPIMELWRLLVHFAAFSGVGIKTALGMGGVRQSGVRSWE